MSWKIIIDNQEYTDVFGSKQKNDYKEYIIPYDFNETVWYCYKRFNKWVVRESKVKSVWATLLVGIRLDNDWVVGEDEYNQLFKHKNEAIDFCVKQNQREKVIVYYK